MIMASVKLIESNPDITREEIRRGLTGNFCRCTGYENIVDAVQAAAAHMRSNPREVAHG
jgi:carbon-monoxide dehydrogenase small subunit